MRDGRNVAEPRGVGPTIFKTLEQMIKWWSRGGIEPRSNLSELSFIYLRYLTRSDQLKTADLMLSRADLGRFSPTLFLELLNTSFDELCKNIVRKPIVSRKNTSGQLNATVPSISNCHHQRQPSDAAINVHDRLIWMPNSTKNSPCLAIAIIDEKRSDPTPKKSPKTHQHGQASKYEKHDANGCDYPFPSNTREQISRNGEQQPKQDQHHL